MPDHASASPAAEWRDTAITFPHQQRPAVGPVHLAIGRGERVLLLGPSGSGKSSLLLALTGLIPKSVPANVDGETAIFGNLAGGRSPAEWSDTVAHYFQDADQVLCGMRVKDEIAFALENQALPPATIELRVSKVMQRLGLPQDWRHRRSLSMSGGERQLVALAAILAQEAPILLVDEPTAHLSPEAASRLHAVLATGASERSCLIVDHRLGGLIDTIDRVVVVGRAGGIIADACPRRLFREHHAALVTEGVWRPTACDLDAHLAAAGINLPAPSFDVAEALDHVSAAGLSPATYERARVAIGDFVAERVPPAKRLAGSGTVASLQGADCAPFLGPVILQGIDLSIAAGEIVALLGRNGAGKSTLAASLAGLLRLKAGRRFGEPGAIALQHPEDQFATGSVQDEIAAMLPKDLRIDERSSRIAGAIEMYGLGGLESRHPFTLSEGQKRRLVLAAVDAADRWPLIVFDEPTAGLDAAGVAGFVRRLEALRERGRALLVITHDMDLALRVADRVVIVGGGRVVVDGPSREILLNADLLAKEGLREPTLAPAIRWLQKTGGS